MRMIIYVTFFKCRYIPVLLITLFLFFLLYSCTGSTPDIRLERISQTISLHPDSALVALRSINKKELNEANRHYYDFLYIKACDKAYIMHKNDSLILDVIDYYSRHNRRKLYGEALYYGGRVYSDLGDSPTALDYFHKALDETEGDPSKIELRTRIYSQGGRLLGNMKMYTEAAGFIKEALQLELEMHPLDTLSYFYDLQLLGETYSFAGKLEQADSVLNLALHYEGYVPDQDICLVYVTLADNYRKSEKNELALNHIKAAKKYISPPTFNMVNMMEAVINFEIGNYNLSFKNAFEVIHNSDPQNKLGAYQMILTPELIRSIPSDSVSPYFERYRLLLNNRYKETDAEKVSYQQAHFNYFKHERDELKARNDKKNLVIWIIILVICILAAILYIQIRRIRFNEKVKELKNALDNIMLLKKSHAALTKQLEILSVQEDSEISESSQSNASSQMKGSVQKLKSLDHDIRIEMRERITKLSQEYVEKGIKVPIDNRIIKSDIYRTLKEYVEKEMPIPENSDIWPQLSQLISKVSPDFSKNLQILVGGTIHSFDEETCMLMKCGFGTKQISILAGRSKTAISSRRSSLNSRIFDTDCGAKGIEAIIQLI